MIRKLGKSMILSAGLAIAAVSAAGLALASIPTVDDDPASAAELRDGGAGFPAAVTGMELFGDATGPVCYDRDAVLAHLDGDRGQIGGELVTLETGFDQDFSNTWRSETDLAAVPVSGVFAHIFPTAGGLNVVDVVEFGGEGCAISRTLLTEDEWNSILVRAAGMSV